MSMHMPTCGSCLPCVLFESRGDTGRLPIFAVYDRPLDAPEHVIVRMWMDDMPTRHAWQFATLEAARSVLAGLPLYRLTRTAEDDPKIVETWL